MTGFCFFRLNFPSPNHQLSEQDAEYLTTYSRYGCVFVNVAPPTCVIYIVLALAIQSIFIKVWRYMAYLMYAAGVGIDLPLFCRLACRWRIANACPGAGIKQQIQGWGY